MEIREGDVIISVDNQWANQGYMGTFLRGIACFIQAICDVKSHIFTYRIGVRLLGLIEEADNLSREVQDHGRKKE